MFAFSSGTRSIGVVSPRAIRWASSHFFYHWGGEPFSLRFRSRSLVESGAVRFVAADEAIGEALIAPYFSSVTTLPWSDRALRPGHWLELRDDT